MPTAEPEITTPGAQAARSPEPMAETGIAGAVADSGDAVMDTDRPTTARGHCARNVPTSLLRRAMEPPTSPRTRARSPLLAMVIILRTPAIQEVEDALSLALVALVLGTRPAVTPAMVAEQLQLHFGIPDERVAVGRTSPDDFIARFSDAKDLERVLRSPWLTTAPFALRWCR